MNYFKSKYFLLGTIFLFLQLFFVSTSTSFLFEDSLLWFCAHTPLLFAVGFYFKQYQVIKGLISVGFIGQIGWALDFIASIFGVEILGVTRYVYTLESTALMISTIAAHFFGTFLALYFTYKKRIKKKSLVVSVLYGLFVFFTTYILTEPSLNINCVFEPCGFGIPYSDFYTVMWPLIAFLVLILPGYYIQYWLHNMSKD